MRLYLLVEGRRTERKLYPAWLSHLLPAMQHLQRFDEIAMHGFYLFSAEGYPSILRQHLANAVKDIARSGNYDYLVVCLDAEECLCGDREAEVHRAIAEQSLDLGVTRLKVIVQNRCIETWLLGNRRIVSRTPQSTRLNEYLRFYDVRSLDPESMGLHTEFSLHAPFHGSYLKEILRERGLTYSKQNPGHVCNPSYVRELASRIADEPGHLRTLQDLFGFCKMVGEIWSTRSHRPVMNSRDDS